MMGVACCLPIYPIIPHIIIQSRDLTLLPLSPLVGRGHLLQEVLFAMRRQERPPVRKDCSCTTPGRHPGLVPGYARGGNLRAFWLWKCQLANEEYLRPESPGR